MPTAGGFADYIQSAYKCGPDIERRDWRSLEFDELSRAEKVMRFAEDHLRIPEGSLVGQPFVVHEFQEAIFYSIFDNPNRHTRRAIVSFARKNGKTALVAVIILAFMVTDLAVPNSSLCSGAMAREQAALIYRYISGFVNQSPDLKGLVHLVPSKKQAVGLRHNVTYTALAKEGSTTVGRSDYVIVGDEWGQISAASDDFVEALITSQGAWDEPLQMVISTQAANDTAMLSSWIDDSIAHADPSLVCWLYEADPECDMDDEAQQLKANPALGIFRSKDDLQTQLDQAGRMPTLENSARNLLLNQRISLQAMFVSPTVWKNNGIRVPNYDLFDELPVWIGLDLSMRSDITAAVAAVCDEEGFIHLKTFAFLPEQNIHDKERTDKAPYTTWARNGDLILVPGLTLDYDWIVQYLMIASKSWNIAGIAFDRWRIDQFKAEADRQGWTIPEWQSVGQGYKDFSPRLETMEGLLLEEKIIHGSAPVLNMAAANAIVVSDPSGNRKLDKSKTILRIDPLVAAVMAVHEAIHSEVQPFDIGAYFA